MKNRTCSLIAVGCLSAMPALASASVISHDQLSSGQDSTLLTLDGVSADVQTIGGHFASKTVAEFSATGVSSGNVNGEIDGSQSMMFTFSQPTYITTLTVAFLYTGGNHGDVENEVALFTTDLGSFSLEATGATSSIWSGYGDAFNVSPGVEGGGGAWTIAGEDIFGGPISTLILSSGNPGAHGRYGDFSFHSMAVSAVPGPGALVLMAGITAFGSTRRR